MPVQNRHFRCMDAKHRPEQCVFFNFKSGSEIGQTRRGNAGILCGHVFRRSFPPDWGVEPKIPLPSGGSIGRYRPMHPTAFHLNAK